MTDAFVQDGGRAGSTSSTLLHRVRSRDPAAWQRFVNLYGPLVYHWGRRAGLQEADETMTAALTPEVIHAIVHLVPDGWLEDFSNPEEPFV